MPLIALAPSWDDEKQRMCIPNDYITAIAAAGGAPTLCSFVDSEALADEMIAHCDGLLLTGGDDVGPHLYGEEVLPCCGELAANRDILEPLLIRAALKYNKPILGICRGLQVLNAVLGGTLYQDVATQYGDKILHPRSDRPREGVHGMTFTAGSVMEQIHGCHELMVNSRHHQAIKTLAPGVKLAAVAEDGLMEGFESISGTPMLAVQWHPESMYATIPVHRAVFNWIVREASR